jgi:hypothetical protein
MAKARGISVVVSGNTAPLRKSLRDAGQELSAFGKAQAKWSQATSLAYGIAGSAAAQFAISSVKAAMEDQKSQALLADQLRKTTGATSSQIAGMEDYIEKTMYASNITDDQLRPALAQLVRVTGSAAKAQDLLGLATDVSVGSGRELGSVVTALGKAYQGSTGALSKLGIQVDAAAVSSQGFSAVTDQLTTQFGGAASAAAGTLAGRMENLTIRFDELKEQLGGELLPVVEEVSRGLLDLVTSAQSGDVVKASRNFFTLADSLGDIVHSLTGVGIATNFLRNLNPFASEAGESVDDLKTRYQDLSSVLTAASGPFDATKQALLDQADAAALADRQVGYLRDQYELFSKVTLQQVDDEKKRQATATATATATALTEKQKRIAYRETAKTLRETLTEALKDAREELKKAQEDADDFGKSFAYSFGVSLSGAYSDAKDSEDAYKQALEGRKDAYDALDVAKQGSDLNAYLKAVQDVATAEQAVTTAQQARITPAAAFAEQLSAAKTFGANLKTLVGQGLLQPGLEQLLNLGPVAGAEVTKALLEGTAGFTVGSLNKDLADLAGVQGGLASQITSSLAPKEAIGAAQSMVDALSSASIGARGVGQGFTINIAAGVGDPVEIGRQVKNVLTQYDTRAGKLTVQGPKKKAKR